VSRRREISIVRPAPRVRTGSIRGALLIGLGLTVPVWLTAGMYLISRIDDLADRTAEIRGGYLRAQELLETARAQVLLSSIHLRDALLADAPEAVRAARLATERSLLAASESLEKYVPVVDGPSEQARVQRLRVEIEQRHKEITGMLTPERPDWSPAAVAVLRHRLTPGREAFMAVADELYTLNRASFLDHQQQVEQVYNETQSRIWLVLAGALGLSLAIVLVSVRHAGRLERQVADQHARGLDLQHDLQRLSSELIRVREEERRMIARELHDEVGQSLTAIKFELAAAQHTLEEGGGPLDLLADVRPIVEQTLQTVRDLSHMLHPSVLDDLGLSAAVDLYIREFRRRHAISVELTETGMGERLPRDVETAAYRIVQEALTNVAKHAEATVCRVSFTRLERSLVVVVGDDGVGFESDRRGGRACGGLGLVSMQERAMQLGGTLVVESGRGHGTRIVVELPSERAVEVAVTDEEEHTQAVGVTAI
jgi:signal transduction histidine kinase